MANVMQTLRIASNGAAGVRVSFLRRLVVSDSVFLFVCLFRFVFRYALSRSFSHVLV
jgi:hypothetical protein